MATKVGLASHDKKLFKALPRKFGSNKERVAHLWDIAKQNFDLGITGFDANPIVIDGHKLGNSGLWVPALSLFQQAFELYLKAFISLQAIDISSQYKNHNLKKMFDDVLSLYPQLKNVRQRNEAYLLLQELGNNFDKIRYGEACLCFRHNSKKGHLQKPLHAELRETIVFIKEEFEKNIKQILSNDESKFDRTSKSTS